MGGCVLANNNSQIPAKELNNLLEAISINYFFIVDEWKKFYGVDDIKYFC